MKAAVAVAFATMILATWSVRAQETERTGDEARARELFTAGRAALDVGRPEQARALLAESLSIAPNAGTAFNLSLVHIELGQMVEANTLLVRLLAGDYGAIAAAQRAIVESKRVLADAGIARVRVLLEGAGSVELSVDGDSVGEVGNGHELTLDAGSHTFVGQNGPASASAERDLAGGSMTELSLHPIDEAALRRAAEGRAREEGRRRRRWALSLTAVAVLAAGGIVAGVLLRPGPPQLQDPVYGNTETLGFSF